MDEIDGTTDIVPVWAGSEQEAIDLAIAWIDAVERRPMYGQPARARVMGSTRGAGDLSDAPMSHDQVAHRRISPDGRELGTIRRPVKARIVELTDMMRTSESDGWRSLRAAMQEVGLDPDDCVLVSEILHVGVPVSGALITRGGKIYGFVKDRDGSLSVAGGEQHESVVRHFAAVSAVAQEILSGGGGWLAKRPMFRRKRIPDDVRFALERLRDVASEIEAAKDAMTSTVPTTRLPGKSLPDALVELEEHLARAKELMAAWRHPEVENEWRACDDAIDESLRRATKLREEAPELDGFEGLIWAVDQLLQPLEPFEAAGERFRTLRR